jgi:hypothetical protein
MFRGVSRALAPTRQLRLSLLRAIRRRSAYESRLRLTRQVRGREEDYDPLLDDELVRQAELS